MVRGPIVALIPARGGSKGIPRKNLAPLAGKPLIHYTFAAALASTVLDRIILSTDDEEIAQHGRDLGIEVPFIRPKALATDEASTRSVQQHLLRWLETEGGYTPEALVTLQATSPLRGPHHINEAVDEFRRRGVDTVLGVTPVREHPYEVVGFEGDRMFRPVEPPLGVVRRQQYPTLYHINGAMYVTRSSVLLEQDSGYGDRVFGYVMDPEFSVDIDVMSDLRFAEYLMRLRQPGAQRPENQATMATD